MQQLLVTCLQLAILELFFLRLAAEQLFTTDIETKTVVVIVQASENLMDFSDLQCHFTWQPEIGDEEKGLNKVKDHLTKTIKYERDMDILCLPLFAYVHCKIEPRQYDEALVIVNDYLSKCEKLKSQERNGDSASGYETVGLSNKAFILKELGKTDEAQQVLKQITKVEDLNEKAQAAIYGVQAFALSIFGPKNYQKGLDLYTKAKKLDKNNYMFHFGTGFLSGRIRRIEEGTHTQPTEMEEGMFRIACELTDWKLPVPIVFLADIIFARGRDFTGSNYEDTQALDEAKHFYKMAYKIGSDSPTVLKISGKGFSILDEEELGEECLLKAIKLDPYSSQAHHRLGQIYEFGKNKRNFLLAAKQYEKAVTAGRRRNFFAECDLCRARKKVDVTYNIIMHYDNMKKHYEFDEKRMEIINSKIKEAKDYQENKRKQAQQKKLPRRY
uniref:Rapsyn myristoylation/linker region N-terminal domain-containing protein n=1 Tax=Strigamia maritima TaxID=126957 RepID=T1JLK3_STRMM